MLVCEVCFLELMVGMEVLNYVLYLFDKVYCVWLGFNFGLL